MMGASRLVSLLLLVAPAVARWCQVENVKADVHGNYSYAGAWRIDGCTTLSLDHGYCAEVDCPWRVKFTDEDIIELADQLHGNTALTALSASSNSISDQGVMAIAEALRDNEALIDLNLAGNAVGNQGAFAIAEVISTNAVFTNLNLEFNKLTDEGGRVLLEKLQSQECALETVHIANNPISSEILSEIAEANKAAFRPPPGHDSTALLEEKDEM